VPPRASASDDFPIIVDKSDADIEDVGPGADVAEVAKDGGAFRDDGRILPINHRDGLEEFVVSSVECLLRRREERERGEGVAGREVRKGWIRRMHRSFMSFHGQSLRNSKITKQQRLGSETLVPLGPTELKPTCHPPALCAAIYGHAPCSTLTARIVRAPFDLA
jgi:hypothetical protein